MNVLVAPFEVMNYALISQLLLNYEKVLKEIDNSLVYVEVVKLGDHCFLVLQILFVSVNQAIAFVNYTANIVKHLTVHVFI